MSRKRWATCFCGGGFRANGDRWRMLENYGKSCLIKCLKCGRKWKSKRLYSKMLPKHVERSRSGISDADILTRLSQRTLIVDRQGTWVWSGISGQFLQIKPHTSPHGGTYRFVTVCLSGKKKSISLHRLVWMSVHRALVPDGYDVDHSLGTCVDGADGIENLRLLASSVNRSSASRFH